MLIKLNGSHGTHVAVLVNKDNLLEIFAIHPADEGDYFYFATMETLLKERHWMARGKAEEVKDAINEYIETFIEYEDRAFDTPVYIIDLNKVDTGINESFQEKITPEGIKKLEEAATYTLNSKIFK